MDWYIKLPTYKTTKCLIWTFFDDKNLYGEFNKCKEKTFYENYLTVFHKCLELHQSELTTYLLELANMILLEDLQINMDLLV